MKDGKKLNVLPSCYQIQKKRDCLKRESKKIHKVYESGTTYYFRGLPMTKEEMEEQKAQWIYPKARMLYDLIPEIWEDC